MPHYLMPDEIIKTIYDIDVAALRAKGFRYILFDLDNTLVPWNECFVHDELKKWFAHLKTLGFSCIIVSNNESGRIAPVAGQLGVQYLEKANKPLKSSVLRSMKKIGAKRRQTVVVGDQLITDIWAGKRARVYTILVTPINNRREHTGTKINRFFESLILGGMGVTRP